MTEGSGTPQFVIVNPHRSQAHSRLSLPYWGLRTGLRFAGPVFRGCGALRAVLTPSPLRGFDGYGLFRALRAAFVRPTGCAASFALIGLPLRLFRALRAAKLRPTGRALRAPPATAILNSQWSFRVVRKAH